MALISHTNRSQFSRWYDVVEIPRMNFDAPAPSAGGSDVVLEGPATFSFAPPSTQRSPMVRLCTPYIYTQTV